MSPKVERKLIGAVGLSLALFLALPIVALLATASPASAWAALRDPHIWPALRLSLATSGSALLVVLLLGTPLAWALSASAGRRVEALLQVPIAIPPAVAGIALLLAFGRRGLFGRLLAEFGVSLSFTTTAVVMAQVFVAAPFYLQAATSAFRRVDRRIVTVARTFGASPLRLWTRIAIPLAWPGLIAGAAMCWARALGEFGATLMFAGNLEGRTQTLPLAIYTAMESDMEVARALSIVLLAVALIVLSAVRLLVRERGEGQRGGQA